MHFTGSIFLFQVPADLFNKIGSERAFYGLDVQDQWSGFGPDSFIGGDPAIFQHVVDDQVAAFYGALRVLNRRIMRGRFRQSSQQRRLFELQVFGMFVEIILGSGFKSIHAVAEPNLVAVHGKDLRLGEVPLNLNGQHGLLDLAAEIALRR